MRTFFFLIYCIFPITAVYAAQTCKPDSIHASTPDSQLLDNGDGTITDSKTGLMWKKCIEGLYGDSCETGSADSFTWQEALQQPGAVNDGGGFASYTDWRLPNIRELRSIVEEQCSNPAINLDRFPNTPSSPVWSGTPFGGYTDRTWSVYFNYGDHGFLSRSDSYAVRLVRGGQ